MNIKSNKCVVLAMGCLLGTGLPVLAQIGTSDERTSGRSRRAAIKVSSAFPSDADFAPGDEVTCDGDLDGSGEVDMYDLALVLDGYGRCRSCAEDIDGDTYVDSRDLAIVLGAWGSCAAERPEDPTSSATDRSVALAVVSAVIGYETDPIETPSPSKGVRFIATNAEELGEEPDSVESQSPRKGVRLIAASGEELTVESLSVPVPVCTGDLNNDGQVDSADLAIMLGSGLRRCKSCSQDFNGDTYINGADFAILLGAWGSCSIE